MNCVKKSNLGNLTRRSEQSRVGWEKFHYIKWKLIAWWLPSGRSSLKIMHFFNVLLHSNKLDRKHKEVQQFILWNLSTFCAPGPNRIAAIFKHFFCKLLFAKTSESICLIKDFNFYLVTSAIPNPTRCQILIQFVKKNPR